MFLLVPAHPGFPGQIPQSRKTVVCVLALFYLFITQAEWNCTDVNEHWQQMKNIMMETAEVTCGLSKGPCSHKETQ